MLRARDRNAVKIKETKGGEICFLEKITQKSSGPGPSVLEENFHKRKHGSTQTAGIF
jgi:hypothetical protein